MTSMKIVALAIIVLAATAPVALKQGEEHGVDEYKEALPIMARRCRYRKNISLLLRRFANEIRLTTSRPTLPLGLRYEPQQRHGS